MDNVIIYLKRDVFYTTLQILWIIFHVARLLLIVEPCHLVATEVKLEHVRQ